MIFHLNVIVYFLKSEVNKTGAMLLQLSLWRQQVNDSSWETLVETKFLTLENDQTVLQFVTTVMPQAKSALAHALQSARHDYQAISIAKLDLYDMVLSNSAHKPVSRLPHLISDSYC